MKITCFLTVVEVDLTVAHFRPGKPNYDRVKWSLSERMGEDVDFVMCHTASGTSYPYPSSRCSAIVTVVITCHSVSGTSYPYPSSRCSARGGRTRLPNYVVVM